MTSFLEVDAADERHVRLASRKAVVVAKQRVDEQYGEWLRQASSREDLDQRLAYANAEIGALVALAADEHGMADKYQEYFQQILDTYYAANKPEEKVCDACSGRGYLFAEDYHTGKEKEIPCDECNGTGYKESARKSASVHESRKPKMCPFHKDVVDISLAAADARAGFDSMAQHWGGPRHCEGEGYEGSKCNFKAPMVTQAYWDQKAEKAEERRQQRAEQAELEAQQGDEIIDDAPVTEGDEVSPDPVAEGDTLIEEPTDNVVEVEFGGGSTNGEEPTAEEIPMSMAASTKESEYKYVKKQGDKWVITQKGTGKVLSTHDSEEKAKAAFRAMETNMHGGSTKTADDVTGLGGPEPTIDKRKWTPQTVPFIDVDDDDGPNPTKRKDIVEPIKPTNGTDRFNPSKLEEIGEQQTEHQDVTEEVDYAKTEGQSGTWTQGPATAVSSTLPNDVNENPITALVKGDYDGFLPASTVQQAIAAYRK